MKPILFIVIFTFVINMFFTTGGKELVSWRFIHITEAGLRSALYMALRLILLVSVKTAKNPAQPSVSISDTLASKLTPKPTPSAARIL